MSSGTLGELAALVAVSGRGSFAVLLERRGRGYEGRRCRHSAARRVV